MFHGEKGRKESGRGLSVRRGDVEGRKKGKDSKERKLTEADNKQENNEEGGSRGGRNS